MGLGRFVCQFLAQGGEVSSLIQTNYEHIALHPNTRRDIKKGHIRSPPPLRGGVAVRHWYVSPHLDKYTISYIFKHINRRTIHTWRQRALQYMSDVHIALQAQRHQLINSHCHPSKPSIKYVKKDYSKIHDEQIKIRKRDKEKKQPSTTVAKEKKRKKKKSVVWREGRILLQKTAGCFFVDYYDALSLFFFFFPGVKRRRKDRGKEGREAKRRDKQRRKGDEMV